MTFRVLAAFAMLLLSAPSALGVQRALAPTRGELAGWLAALGIELAYLSLALIEFDDQQRQRNAARVAKTAVATAIVLNVLADYAARVPDGLTGAAAFLATFDWLLLVLSVLESAPLAGLAYTLAVLLHTRSKQSADAASSMLASSEQMLASTSTLLASAERTTSSMLASSDQMLASTDTAANSVLASADTAASSMLASSEQMLASTEHTASTLLASSEQMLVSASTLPASAERTTSSMLASADASQHPATSYTCPRCNAALSLQQYAAAKRYKRCVKCKQ